VTTEDCHAAKEMYSRSGTALKAQVSLDPGASGKARPTTHVDVPMNLRRVILADDLALVLKAESALLRESFDIVAMVSDGHAALEAILKHEPELAVLDISMPGMSGIDVASEARRRGNKTRIVFLTVHEDADILAACLSVGGLGYVIKVYMNHDLIPAINAALGGRVFVSRFS
jgi:DNA-binding NarL/FixJ family response regulator